MPTSVPLAFSNSPLCISQRSQFLARYTLSFLFLFFLKPKAVLSHLCASSLLWPSYSTPLVFPTDLAFSSLDRPRCHCLIVPLTTRFCSIVPTHSLSLSPSQSATISVQILLSIRSLLSPSRQGSLRPRSTPAVLRIGAFKSSSFTVLNQIGKRSDSPLIMMNDKLSLRNLRHPEQSG